MASHRGLASASVEDPPFASAEANDNDASGDPPPAFESDSDAAFASSDESDSDAASASEEDPTAFAESDSDAASTSEEPARKEREVGVPWPSLDAYCLVGLAPCANAPRDGAPAAQTFARAHEAEAREKAKRFGRLNKQTEAMQRKLWKRSVKDWLDGHDRGADWELAVKDELLLVGWFNAIDVNRSGTIELAEVVAFLRGAGFKVSTKEVIEQFASIGRLPADGLDAHGFMRLLSKTGGDFDNDGKPCVCMYVYICIYTYM